ncbi:hypothetical protein BDK51DRAFT_28136, partial [Blyttiomyces helicus]
MPVQLLWTRGVRSGKIYDACGGPSWTIQGGWGDRNGSLGPICPPPNGFEQPSIWAGVQCWTGRVDKVELSGANLSCPNGFPDSAAWYTSYWAFSNNRIGVVPDSWFMGANVTSASTRINFSSTWLVNDLTKAGLNIRSRSGSLKIPGRVISLDVSSNNLTGVIPNPLADTPIRQLYLENNNFY